MNEYDTLWNEATDLMVDLDEKYNRETRLSLDEYLYKWGSTLEPKEFDEIIKLLERLSNITQI
tara:strand:- start:360 stop:548 length:189 start_codon:yes stop_codon:yes gene_type:complete